MSKASYNIRKLETAAFDTRVVARQIGKGRVTHAELAKHLKGLDDSSDNAEEVMVTLLDDEEEAGDEEAAEEATGETAEA